MRQHFGTSASLCYLSELPVNKVKRVTCPADVGYLKCDIIAFPEWPECYRDSDCKVQRSAVCLAAPYAVFCAWKLRRTESSQGVYYFGILYVI
ncbi:hypothetical protein FKM82_029059 [Ascaphus truei]